MPETLRYRSARTDELAEIGRLVTHSFPGPDRAPTYWEAQLRDLVARDGIETILAGEDQGRLAASLLIHPMRQWIAGQKLPMAGIGLVTVSPTHRKRRVAGDLMTVALRVARERGDQVSALYPFRVSFYQKLGYGQAGEALQYQISPSDLGDFPERVRVELLDSEPAHLEALDLYHRWASHQTGQLERKAPQWAQQIGAQDRGLFGYRSGRGELEGYALVAYHTGPPPRQRYLDVDELVWTTMEARRGLYGWLASLGDQWQQIVIRGLPSQRLGDWIREPRLPLGSASAWGLSAPGATLMMGAMFRLLDVEKAWAQRTVALTSPLAVMFNVTDDQIQENKGSWRVAFDGNRATVDRHGVADAVITLNISSLSRLYIGSLPPRAALEAGLLECDRPEVLDRLGATLALPEAWTFDRF